jgi:hypothetical protein
MPLTFLLPFFVGEPETAPCRIGPLNEYRF